MAACAADNGKPSRRATVFADFLGRVRLGYESLMVILPRAPDLVCPLDRMAQLKVSHGRKKRTCPEGFAIVDGAGVTPHSRNVGANSLAVNLDWK